MTCAKALSDTDFEHILCAPFGLAALSALSIVDLAHLDATSRSFQESLHPSVWASAARSFFLSSRVSLPFESLAAMPVPKLKIVLSNMRSLCASLGSPPLHLHDSVELNAISRICSHTSMHEDIAKVVVGRLHFDMEDLCAVAGSSDEESVDGGELFCFSSELGFSLPDRGGTLYTTLGCRRDGNILEVCRVSKPSVHEIVPEASLSFDLHLVSSQWYGTQSAVHLSMPSTGGCTKFLFPGLDVTQEQTRQILASPEGVLCLLVVRSCTPGQALQQSAAAAKAWQLKSTSPCLNALALEVPTSRQTSRSSSTL
jgi:hypothetical protein